MGDYSSQITVCGSSVRHHFKEIRCKSKQVGTSFVFWSQCLRCTAKMQTIVSSKADEEGNIKPCASYYLHLPGHAPERMEAPPKA